MGGRAGGWAGGWVGGWHVRRILVLAANDWWFSFVVSSSWCCRFASGIRVVMARVSVPVAVALVAEQCY